MEEWEWAAGELYRLVGADPDDPEKPSRLSRRAEIQVFLVPNMVDHAALSVFQSREVIGVRKSLSAPYREHAIGHELGHWVLRRLGLADSETAADYIGAAIQMPRKAFRRRAHEVGQQWAQLALDFGATETSAALRYAETDSIILAVVCPHRIYARGEAQWPPETTLRRWARQGGPGLKTARLGDDRRRTVVEVELCEIG